MEVSERGLALIREFEGFSPVPYICPAGVCTIGYGHVIGAGERFPESGLTKEDGKILLKQDINMLSPLVFRLLKMPVTQPQFDAMASLVYNIGIKAFEKSTLLRLSNQGEIQAAGQEFHRWVYAKGRKLPGLIRRRAAEALLYSADT